MAMPMRQNLRIGSYLLKQKLRKTKKFPLVLELEPLFACNLKCAGCGKIQQPASLLKQRMPVEQALKAVRECGAPALLVDDAGELDLDRLRGVRRIGLTAGASAPPGLVDELVHCLSGLGPIRVHERTTVTEDIRFALPKEVT